MAPVPGFVELPPDSTGKQIDMVAMLIDALTVYRQTLALGDPSDQYGYAAVLNDNPSHSDYGLAVRSVNQEDVPELLFRILNCLEEIKERLP